MSAWIEKLSLEKNNLQLILDSEAPKKLESVPEEKNEQDPVSHALAAIDKTKYESITKFGWEQTGKQLKVYITEGMNGVGALKDNVSCEFEDKSFDLRIHGLNGKNYRLKVPELQSDISISLSKFNVKSNSISITLAKSK